jgi:hypothetical protein
MAELPKDKPEVCPALFISIDHIERKGDNIMSKDNGLTRLRVVLTLESL